MEIHARDRAMPPGKLALLQRNHRSPAVTPVCDSRSLQNPVQARDNCTDRLAASF